MADVMILSRIFRIVAKPTNVADAINLVASHDPLIKRRYMDGYSVDDQAVVTLHESTSW